MERLVAIKDVIAAVPQAQEWPEVLDMISRFRPTSSISYMDYPLRASQAVGGRPDAALPGAAAIYCMLTSIHLVDDLLDEDPRGIHHEWGVGRAANLALALQGMASQIIERDTTLDPACRAAIHRSLTNMAIDTAYGQHLDVDTLDSEAAYWRVIERKTPPLLSSALYVGVRLGGGDHAVGEALATLGRDVGLMVQVQDDLGDAMAQPARPDWARRCNNLPILYGVTADYAERDTFLALLDDLDADDHLARAQEILVRCGAVSYCLYRMLGFFHAAKRTLDAVALVDEQPIREIIEQQIAPMRHLFDSLGFTDWDGLVASTADASASG
ncbi:MAG: polyprenyl synthetase family protein [Acidobacteriota bacterium]